jgi:hypothetical protein
MSDHHYPAAQKIPTYRRSFMIVSETGMPRTGTGLKGCRRAAVARPSEAGEDSNPGSE